MQGARHEIQIALPAQAHRECTDHLVEGDAALNDRCRRAKKRHAVVHRRIHQPEGDGFVADKSLQTQGTKPNKRHTMGAGSQRGPGI